MKKRYRILIGVGIVLVGLISAGILAVNSIEKGLADLVETEIEDVDLSMVQDGDYEGSYTRLPISVKVLVKIEDHHIVDINILEHLNGQGETAEVIVSDVIANDSIVVDCIAGATYSSKCILLAIKEAIEP